MRMHGFLLVSVALLTQGAASAQNSDFAVLSGITWPVSEVVGVSGAYIRNSIGVSGQFNYAFQTFQRAVDLYVELPVVLSARDAGAVTGAAVDVSSGLDIFFTPGVRVKLSPESRVSVYTALGGGIASFGGGRVTYSGATVSVASRTTTAALDFGGGVDFRLTRLLSLRCDLRDFVTRAGLGGTTGMHHGVFDLGIAFHF